ncbi:formamidopyrimidine-DNA glycosylase [Lactobacillus plantarum JDM1] [Lactiplantibacillus mudanjiangensis]|nr:formamidopyrimidine-DNA glycosylase [Lactobacillus plantarum JDM1] [Lactiplantibacillus mudanjiangensis]
MFFVFFFCFFFQAEDGIRDSSTSRGLGDVYKRQGNIYADETLWMSKIHPMRPANSLTDDEIVVLRQSIIDEMARLLKVMAPRCCLLYTSDAADEEDSVDLGGRRIIKKKKKKKHKQSMRHHRLIIYMIRL